MSFFVQSRKAATIHQQQKYRRILQNVQLAVSSERSISSSSLAIEKTADMSRFDNRPRNEDLKFGHTISDHMLIVEWNKQDQWTAPRIVPYQDLKISPAATCLNYGMFEVIWVWAWVCLFLLQYQQNVYRFLKQLDHCYFLCNALMIK